WTKTLGNGMKVTGIQQDEIPVVTFSLVIEGGHLLDTMEKNGVANLMSDILMEGTANKTPEELEEEIDLLGANINMYTTRESIVIRGNTLTRNLQKTLDLVTEIIMEPRWDEEELARLKTKTINDIERSDANPNAVANRVYSKILYGDDHIFSYPTFGTVESVKAITMQDLKDYYHKNFSPSVSTFQIVGKIDKDAVLKDLKPLEDRWPAKEVIIPEYPIASSRD